MSAIPMTWVERLARLHEIRAILIKARDDLHSCRLQDFYQDRVTQVTNEIVKIENDWGAG